MHFRRCVLAGLSEARRSRGRTSAGEDRKHDRLVQRTLDAMAEQVTRKPYLRPISRTRWFFGHPRYLRYMAREITCIFIGAYAILLIVGIASLAAGPDAYQAFLLGLQTPASIVFHVLALAFSLYHSFTWFNL